jgi:hypothetical protein
MTEHLYTKKYVKKDGSVVIYHYSKESKVYSKNYYNKQIQKNKTECEYCHAMVYPHYMLKHQKTMKCQKLQLLTEDSENDFDTEELKEIFLMSEK